MLRQQSRGAFLNGVGQKELPARWCPESVLRNFEGTLIDHLEVPDLFDLVAPELNPQWMVLGGREDIQDPPAHGQIAATLDQLTARIAGSDQPIDELGQICRITGTQRDRLEITQTGYLRLKDGSNRGHHDRERAGAGVGRVRVPKASQDRQPATDGVRPR